MTAGGGSAQPTAEVPRPADATTRVAIVGGGLAGLAAAVALADRGRGGPRLAIELFEARRQLGGRAGSFHDAATGEWIDHCQHVGLGCCTNLADFCRRAGLADCFRRDRVLHFFAPDGRRHDLAASRWLPAPFHLAPSLARLSYLSWRERWRAGAALARLARSSVADEPLGPTILDWLLRHGQSQRAIELFWTPVIASALGETCDRAGLAAARKVFVDGFMAARTAYEIDVPIVPFGELYGDRLARWLDQRGVVVHLAARIDRVLGDARRITAIVPADQEPLAFDYVVLALPWRRIDGLFPDAIRHACPLLAEAAAIESSPISAVHLWYDRELTSLPHAVLLGRLSQWVFNRGTSGDAAGPAGSHYLQVVISGSRNLAGTDRDRIVATVDQELRSQWPAAHDARLLHARLVTDPVAVFSVRPGLDRLRPPQRTAIGNLMLAGDWTATGWPATMESAVRSGYLAAEAVLAAIGSPFRCLVPDLARSWLARLLLRA